MPSPATQSATASSPALGADDAPPWTPSTKGINVTFNDNGMSRVFSLTSNTVYRLPRWLDGSGQGVEDDEASLIVLGRSFGHAKKPCVWASLAQMQTLVRHCGIPRKVMDYIMKYEILGGRPISATDWPLPQSPCTWHAVPVPNHSRGAHLTILVPAVDQILAFQMPALVDGSASPARSGPLKILLVVNETAMFKQASDVVQASRGQPAAQDTLNVLYGHLLAHLEGNVVLWSDSYGVHGSAAESNIAQVKRESEGILTPEAFTTLDESISRLEQLLDGMRRLEATTVYVSKLFAPAAERNLIRMENLDRTDALLALIHCGIQTLERRYNWSMFEKGTIVETVHVNNNRLARDNISELRRIAEQNLKDAAVFQKISLRVAQDSRQMKRLAYLNMAFLPSAMAAAFFSTPFMALDDTMSFKASGKLWMFFLLAGILTAATFATSVVWDRVEHGRMLSSSRLGADGNMDPSGEEAVEGSGGRHLEPNEQPVFTDHQDALLAFLDMMRRKESSASTSDGDGEGDGDGDGGSTAENGATTSGVEAVSELDNKGEGNGAGAVRRRG
ncbi:hypothetical protein MAPG_00211 [Magnaporthiopsis poae ATCC 64411]|uniref:Uncharacterized protein n=1 Tax=Magnaporthiopsis poae (strain ATCC 64411 / 73-15) TaxID=644358 RepID=A0A0C4DKE2_MAGP6|nr:hypothetical protein MAPG_00211 [Magnaporthiopsis poae ATCC 64411]